MPPRSRIGVIGAGLMGHGIAQVFAAAGHDVAVYDSRPETLASVRARVRANLESLSEDASAADRIGLCGTLEGAVHAADVVIEAVVEDLAVKRALLARLDRIVGRETIVATNTSVIRIGEIASGSAEPGRVVGTHFWNPPYLVPLVEVTQSAETSVEVVSATMALLEDAGKQPVHVRLDLAGSVGNRLQHALWREAVALVDAGVVDAESLDRIVKSSFGMRLQVLGPIENADLVGLDLTLAIHEYLLPHLDSRPMPAPLLRELVARGDLGMKTGCGFRVWTDDEADAVRSTLTSHLVAERKRVVERTVRTPQGEDDA